MAIKEKKVELLDHNADGIQEFDNSLPKWWLYGFYLTIVFAVAYMAHFHFLGGPSSKQEWEQEMAEAEMLKANMPKAAKKAAILLTDAASLAAGKVLFEGDNLCSTCHKDDMGGLVGPNLTDEYWIHGCSIEEITTNITTGFPDMGMLPYGNNTKLSDEQLVQVASYIISKKGTKPAEPKEIDPAREVVCPPKGGAPTASK